MIILLVGSGAREHAIARALSLDPAVTALHAAPGNPGIGDLATLHAVDALDGAAVAALATELAVPGAGCRVPGAGCRVPGAGCRVP